MRGILRSLIILLAPHECRALLKLIALSCVLTALELLGAGSFFWYTAIITDTTRIASDPLLRAFSPILPMSNPRTLFLILGIGVLFIMVMRGACSALNLYAQSRFSLRVRNRLSLQVLRRYLTMPYEEAVAVNTAVLTKHLLVEVSNVVTCIQQTLLLATEGLIAATLVVLVAAIDPFLVFMIVGGLGTLTVGTIIAARRRVAVFARTLEQCNGQLYQASAQALQGAKEIRAFDAEDAFLRAFRDPLERSATIGVYFEVWSGVPGMLMNLVAFGTLLAIFLVILARGGTVTASIPTIATIAFVLQRLLPSANRMYNGLTLIRKYAPGVAIIREAVADVPPIAQDPEVAPLTFTQEFRFTDVQFTYRGSERPVLDRVSLVIPYRSALGIVGASGAGKSTLVDLLLGLLEPTDGMIACDGVPITRGRRAALRRLVGYVPQQTFLLDDTIRANVAFGVASAAVDDARVERALCIAQLDALVMSLPKGIETPIGERGIRLSGGQRQRLGIARALYRDPTILVLDEATSALDPETERAFLSALAALAGTVTLVVIAHRLSSLRICSRVAFLDQGRIEAIGTVPELTSTCPAFRERYLAPFDGISPSRNGAIQSEGDAALTRVL